MTPAEVQHLPCPSCGAAIAYEVRRVVDAGREPDLKAALLKHALMRLACGACAHEAAVEHDLLYQDTARRLFLFLRPDAGVDATSLEAALATVPGAADALAGATCRVVRHRNELVEKILVADAGLDDRALESLKFMLVAQRRELLRCGVYFDGVRDDAVSFVAVDDERERRFTMPLQAYAELARELESRGLLASAGGPRWLQVDALYGARLVQRLADAA